MPVSFQELKLNEEEAIYIQVIRHFKKLIYNGILENGEEVPSRRVLAAMLGINLTTVQKIYKDLEAEHLIETLPNSKTLVSVDEKKIKQLEVELVDQRVKRMIEELKSMKLDFKDAINLLTKFWDT